MPTSTYGLTTIFITATEKEKKEKVYPDLTARRRKKFVESYVRPYFREAVITVTIKKTRSRKRDKWITREVKSIILA